MTTSRLLSPLGVRLAVAFVAVAVTAVAVLAGLTLVAARSEVSSLVTETHRQDAAAAAGAAGAAYEQAGGWAGAVVTSAAAIAARGQAELTVLDASGQVLAVPAREATEMMARMHGVAILDVPRQAPVTAPVTVDGEIVGSVELRFPASHLPGPERQVREALSRNALLGAGLATVAAIAAAVLVARIVSRPLNALTAAAADLEAGRRDVRVDLGHAPGELGVLASTFDRMAAAVEREDLLRRRLVADVAHEVRTPLTILRGTTEALVDGVAEPDDATLRSLHEEVLRLTRLVTDLETLAAADAAGLHLSLRPLDLAAVAAAVIELARPAADAADLAITAALTPAPVIGDERRLRQVVTTLLANSLTYTPAGGSIHVVAEVRREEAVVEVRDTGPGIAPEDLPHVFDRFYRGARTADTPGSGIGLAIARELAVAHQGAITVADRPEGGAAFTLALPVATA
jgi:signal transduction histidine kinase